MSFTDQKPRIATEKDVCANWSCGKNGEFFRCYLCGHKFQVGDYWRWVYNNTSSYDGKQKVNYGNFIVCKECDGEDILGKWEKANIELKERFWWATR